MLKKNHIIFLLIVGGILCRAVSTCFQQIHMEADFISDNHESWYNKLGYVGDVILSVASVLSFFKYRSRFPLFVSNSFLLLLLLIFIASFLDLGKVVTQPSLFYSPKGIGTWINFGILFFMADEVYRDRLLKVFLYLCYFFVGVNILQLVSVGMISNRTQALFAIRDTTVFLIWIYPFFFLRDNTSDKKQYTEVIQYVMILIIGFFAVAIASRSYLLIVILFLLIKLWRDMRGRISIYKFGMLVVGFGFGYYYLINSDGFQIIEGFVEIFANRIDEDSRSSQLEEFFSQYDYENLISGVGPLATWNWAGHNQPRYEWLDNQFILIGWWFGLPTCIAYIAFLAYSILKKNRIKEIDVTNAKIIIFFWFLACGGLAIYVTVSTKLFYYFISLLIGLVTAKRSLSFMRLKLFLFRKLLSKV